MKTKTNRFQIPILKIICICLLITPSFFAMGNVCDTGRLQSPINITKTKLQNLPSLQFKYSPSTLIIANDGHTLRVRMNSNSRLKIGNQSFTLSQFHFHTPGGDQINGEEFPMAAHFLHKNPSGKLLAVVVLFRVGNENPTLRTLLPLIPPQIDGNHSYPDIKIDATTLVPNNKGYYRYLGSLTAPPCTEGVEWIVLKIPIELSAPQLAAYRKRFLDNARIVQPLNERPVYEMR